MNNIYGDYNYSKITLGTVQLGMNYGINNQDGQPSLERANRILDQAVAEGINVFDSSVDYSTSEKIVGDYFKQKKDKPLIVTKFSIDDYKSNLTEKEIEKIIYNQVETSLNNLGYEKLPLLLTHDEMDIEYYGDTIIKVLKKMQQENMVFKVGASLNHFSYVGKVLGYDFFEAVQLPLNLFNVKDAMGKDIAQLRKNGIKVFIRSVYLQGLFFKDVKTFPETGVLSKAKEPVLRLQNIAKELGISVEQLAFSFIRDIKGITSLVLGAEKPEQVLANAKLLKAPTLSKQVKDLICESFIDVDRDIISSWLWNK